MNQKKGDTPYGGNLKALDTLFGAEPAPIGEMVALSDIKLPGNQPRKYFDPIALAELADSVAAKGVLQPLVVRPAAGGLELVAGERRYRAAKLAGLSEVPVVVRDLSEDDAAEVALIENLQREDLNPVEETLGILTLLERRLGTDREAVISLLNQAANAKRKLTDSAVRKDDWARVEATFNALGTLTPEAFRSHRLPLLNLPLDILEALQAGKLHYTKAKVLARVKDDKKRQMYLERTLSDNLSLKQVEELVKATSMSAPSAKTTLLGDVRRQLTPNVVRNLPSDKQTRLNALLKEIKELLS